ncbi:hypothetical protein ACO0QE_002736 [Hanseniaspora vineae]
MSGKTGAFNTPKKLTPEPPMSSIRNDILKTPSVQRNIARVREEQIMKNITNTPGLPSSLVAENWASRAGQTSLQGQPFQQIQANKQFKDGKQSLQQEQQQLQQTQTYVDTVELKKDRLNLSVGIQLKRVLYSAGLNLLLKYAKLLLLSEKNAWVEYAIKSSLGLIFLNVAVLIYYLIQIQKLNFLKASMESSNLTTTTTTIPNYSSAISSFQNDSELHKKRSEYTENNTPYLFKNIQSTPLKSNSLNLRRTSTAESLSSFPSNSHKSHFQNILSATGPDRKATGYIPSSKYTFKMMDTPRKATYI